ncbi:hypothetical protein D9615_008074 [Tricholomella constricta]|uniref:Uncharacterized protein n=1 Tax=Tricholomella constricta TaxID=117010 RepID=A0A8H5GW32_9AGAR|nr:hypothetical protein D9615_008074 [Tricholomella constricta]
MNHDVDDPEKGVDLEQDGGRTTSRGQKSHILTRIRNFNTLAISSIGSAFSGPLSAMSSYVLQESPGNSALTNYNCDVWDYACDLEAGCPTSYDQTQHHEIYHTVGTSTPTQTRSNSPLQSSRLQDVKRIFNNFARSRHADSHVLMDAAAYSSIQNSSKTSQKHTNPAPLYAPSASPWDEPSGTPPLTPDSFEDLALPSPAIPGDYDYEYDDEDDAVEWNRSYSHSLEIKEGKKPERASASIRFSMIQWSDLTPAMQCYDALIEDASGPNSDTIFEADLDTAQNRPPVAIIDDRDEWYGLEYTLELSCRERLPSDTKSAGEHSRSRESWAAIHQGSIHPFFEDEDYYQWKNWHRYLDRQDERRKHRRGWEFKARSKDLAWFYEDEMKTRDVMYWQKEVYGVVTRDVKERLNALAEHRPDPYSPPKKHNLGWYLKRSRSVACLRELRPLPVLKYKVRAHEYDDTPPNEFSFNEYFAN